MDGKKLTIWLFMALTVLSGMVYADAGEKQEQRAITTPKNSLQDIERYISQSRKRIEYYYASRLEELELRAEEEFELFVESEMDALDSAAVSADLLFATHGIIPANYIMNENGLMLPIEIVALAENRIAEKEEEILESLELDIANLEKKKKYALNVGLVDSERRLKRDAFRPEPKPTHGVVMGIVYGEDKQLAMIDREIVRPGEIIHGVKVVKIQRDSVEFEKDSKVWKQKVRGKAKAFWK